MNTLEDALISTGIPPAVAQTLYLNSLTAINLQLSPDNDPAWRSCAEREIEVIRKWMQEVEDGKDTLTPKSKPKSMAMTGADRSKRFRIKNRDAFNAKAKLRMRAKRAAAKAAKVAGKTAVKPAPRPARNSPSRICSGPAQFDGTDWKRFTPQQRREQRMKGIATARRLKGKTVEIQNKRSAGALVRDLAEEYGCVNSTMQKILRNIKVRE